MKRNYRLFLGALLILGLGLTQLPKVLSQDEESDSEKAEKPSAEVEAIMTASLKTDFPDATFGEFHKTESAGTNSLFAVEFSSLNRKMRAIVASEGTVMETEEPADIKTFPAAANEAVRKAITTMGTKDLGVRLGRTLAEVKQSETNGLAIVKLSEPVLTYRADVKNNLGKPGKYSFKADGTLIQKPSWAK